MSREWSVTFVSDRSKGTLRVPFLLGQAVVEFPGGESRKFLPGPDWIFSIGRLPNNWITSSENHENTCVDQ